MGDVDRPQPASVMRRIGDAAHEPQLWPTLLRQICQMVGAVSALLLQGDMRPPDAFVSPELVATIADDDSRRLQKECASSRTVIASSSGVLASRHLPEAGAASPKSRPDKFERPAVTGRLAEVVFSAGAASWTLSVERGKYQAPFSSRDEAALAVLAQPLTDAATLSNAIGRSAIESMLFALEAARRPAVVLDRSGFVLDANRAAEALMTRDVRIASGRILVRDQDAKTAFSRLLDYIRTSLHVTGAAATPIIVRRAGKWPLVIRPASIGPVAHRPFLRAAAMLTFTDLGHGRAPDAHLISRVFRLTQAEARLASLVAAGLSPQTAATLLEVSPLTVRSQLRAVFAKTATHRQSELVALLARLSLL